MREFVAQFRSTVVADPDDTSRPAGANLLGTLATYPDLAIPFLTFNMHLLAKNSLSKRHKELLILRVAHLRKSEYEWAQHSLLAGDVGISSEEIARVAQDPGTPGWSVFERTLLTAADELILDGTVTSDTWTALARDLDNQQLMDLVFTVGSYAMLGMALRAFGVQPEGDLIPHLPTFD